MGVENPLQLIVRMTPEQFSGTAIPVEMCPKQQKLIPDSSVFPPVPSQKRKKAHAGQWRPIGKTETVFPSDMKDSNGTIVVPVKLYGELPLSEIILDEPSIDDVQGFSSSTNMQKLTETTAELSKTEVYTFRRAARRDRTFDKDKFAEESTQALREARECYKRLGYPKRRIIRVIDYWESLLNSGDINEQVPALVKVKIDTKLDPGKYSKEIGL
jgi:hypothetical protein